MTGSIGEDRPETESDDLAMFTQMFSQAGLDRMAEALSPIPGSGYDPYNHHGRFMHNTYQPRHHS